MTKRKEEWCRDSIKEKEAIQTQGNPILSSNITDIHYNYYLLIVYC